MRLPSLKRWRESPTARDEVIDLTDAASASVDEAAVSTASDDICGEPDVPVDADAEAAAEATTAGSDPDTGGPGEARAPESIDAMEHGEPAVAAGVRVRHALGYVLLNRSTAGTLPPLASLAAAVGWLVGVVMLGTVAVTMAIGAIGPQPLIYPPVLVSCFRVAHGMPLQTGDGAVSLVPMLPAIVVVLLIVRATTWLWHALHAPTSVPPLRGPAPFAGLGLLAAAYTLVATLVATSPTSGAASVPPTQGWAALLGVVLIGIGAVIALQWIRPTYSRLWLLIRASSMVVALVLAVSFALVLVRLLLTWSQVQAMSDELLASAAEPASRFDAIALGALQLAYLPNIVVWVAAYLLGAGFAVGNDTIVSPFSVTIGTVPELPLAALLPTSGLRWPWIPLLFITLASVLAGAGIRSAGLARQMRTRLVIGSVVALWAAIAFGVLAAVANGGLGDGRLAVMGPNPWVTMLWALLVIGLGQVAWALFPTLLADVVPLVREATSWARGLNVPRPQRPRRARETKPRRPRRRRRQ